MSTSVEASANAPEHQGLKDQILGLDSRFWIVNIMEMFERLAYYGVRAVIAIYIVLASELGGPEFSHVQKGVIFAWWAYVQSVLPVFSGGFADRYGHKNTVAVAIVLKIIGYVMMAHLMSFSGFLMGCIMLAAGTAIFKPGVQGTLAATLKDSNASVGWGIFYQLVNVGGFLGPVLAGVLRILAWKYVFYSCAVIVAINFLWLPFYKDPTQEVSREQRTEDTTMWSALSRSLTPGLVRFWLVLWGVLSPIALYFAYQSYSGTTEGYWEMPFLKDFLKLHALLFFAAFLFFTLKRDSYDAGRSDPRAIFVLSVVGLFRHRVIWFCLVFAGFWLMFNQVFDLLPNVIDDWVDSSSIIGALGSFFSSATATTVVAVVLGLLFGGLCASGIFLSLRPDRRPVNEVPAATYAVVAIALWGALHVALRAALPGVEALETSGYAALAAVMLAFVARRLQIPGKTLLWGAFAVGSAGALVATRSTLEASASQMVEMAAAGAQVPPEWMINLNPGLIVFTMIFFAYLTSFVKPLTSIIIGMIVATGGSIIAGTAVLGWACLAGIFVFSVGEMLSSPKKMEYLATLSPKGQEAMFMGYVNMPVAIGWIAGSIFAGNRYEEFGDKVNLARGHLVDVVGLDPTMIEGLEKTKVLPMLADKLDLTAMQTQTMLFETYHPESLWYDIGLVGLVSIIGMIAYDRALAYVDRKKAA